MTIKNILIFDLDGTTIDSSHRQATKADGTLDLQAWFKNATPEKIHDDKPKKNYYSNWMRLPHSRLMV